MLTIETITPHAYRVQVAHRHGAFEPAAEHQHRCLLHGSDKTVMRAIGAVVGLAVSTDTPVDIPLARFFTRCVQANLDRLTGHALGAHRNSGHKPTLPCLASSSTCTCIAHVAKVNAISVRCTYGYVTTYRHKSNALELGMVGFMRKLNEGSLVLHQCTLATAWVRYVWI